MNDEQLKKINIKKIIYEFIRVNKQNVNKKDEQGVYVKNEDVNNYISILQDFVKKIFTLETDLKNAQNELQNVDAAKKQEVLDLKNEISKLQLEYERFVKSVKSKMKDNEKNNNKKFEEWLLNHLKDSENSDSETMNSLRSIYNGLELIYDSSEFSGLTRENLEKHKKKIEIEF